MCTLTSKRYLQVICVFVATPLVCVFIVNCVIDPLWYLKGNVITSENYAFDERLSKTNRLLRMSGDIDSFIFGSSRVTLIKETTINNHRCFNYSFSAGKIGEFVAFGTYIKSLGFAPKLVIVGVDGLNCFAKSVNDSIPDFIRSRTRPPSFMEYYSSLDAFKLSLRSLQKKSPRRRYYASEVSPRIISGTLPYDLSRKGPNWEKKYKQTKPYYPGRITRYRRLVELFQDSRIIFYVPPIAEWRITLYEKHESLEDYLMGIYSVAELGAPLYDLSIPSYITINPENTYDGSHYSLRVNDLIAHAVNTGTLRFGVEVTGMDYNEYRTAFLNALYKFRK